MASGAKKPQEFDLEFGREIGRGMSIGDKMSTKRTKARVVLKNTPNGPRILTAYPIE